MRIEESFNVTFDESFPEPKSSPSVKYDRIIEPIVHNPVRSPSLEANALEPGYLKSVKKPRGHPIEQVIGELNKRTLRISNVITIIIITTMVLPDNQISSPNSVLDDKVFENSSNDSDFNVDLYLNDEEDNGDNLVIPHIPNEELRTRIYNTRIPPSLIRGIGEEKI
ncbi:hypothetical protein Tco_0963170 [Tanacetum coccineum]